MTAGEDLRNPDLPDAWVAALAARRHAHDLADPEICLRLLHGEDESVRCDRFGQVCWFYRYEDRPLSSEDLRRYTQLTQAAGARHWHAHDMHNRGGNPQTGGHACSADAPPSWLADENGLRFELRAGSGQSPGLFLDQRRNRAWVRQQAQGARVLNLFAYTGGFGVAALAGGAANVVQVDTSRSYLDWARTNASANSLPDDRVEYSAVDARLLVQGCHKRSRRFDGIICDPPSFGRGRGRGASLFRVERDLADLVSACAGLVDAGGWLLVSSNYEGWNKAHFEAVVAAAGRGADRGTGAAIEAAPGAGDDFLTGDASPLLNSCILRLK